MRHKMTENHNHTEDGTLAPRYGSTDKRMGDGSLATCKTVAHRHLDTTTDYVVVDGPNTQSAGLIAHAQKLHKVYGWQVLTYPGTKRPLYRSLDGRWYPANKRGAIQGRLDDWCSRSNDPIDRRAVFNALWLNGWVEQYDALTDGRYIGLDYTHKETH